MFFAGVSLIRARADDTESFESFLCHQKVEGHPRLPLKGSS